MTEYCFATGHLRTALTDYYQTVNSTVSRDTATFGYPVLKSDATSPTVVAGVSTIFAPIGMRKQVYRFDFYYTVYPGSQSRIAQINTLELRVEPSGTQQGKLIIVIGSNTSQDSTFALSPNTWYQIEFYFDKDQGAGGFGQAGFLINGTLNRTYDLVAGDAQPTMQGLGIGWGGSKSTSPNSIAYYKNVYCYLSDSVTAYPTIGTLVCEEYSLVPNAVGTANDFTPDSGTLKYDRVNESPSDGDTSYVYKDFTGSPLNPCSAAVGGAGVLNSTYSYKYTNVTANGESTGSTVSANVSPANQQVNLTNIAAGPIAGSYPTTARKVYRSKAGASGGPWYLLTTLNDNTTTTYTDNTADAGLGATIPITSTSTPILRQRFKFGTIPIFTSTIKGMCCFNVRRASTNASAVHPFYESVFDNSVAYETHITNDGGVSTIYTSYNIGYATRPGDNSNWTTASLAAVEAGLKVDINQGDGLDLSAQYRFTAEFMVVATVNTNLGGIISVGRPLRPAIFTPGKDQLRSQFPFIPTVAVGAVISKLRTLLGVGL